MLVDAPRLLLNPCSPTANGKGWALLAPRAAAAGSPGTACANRLLPKLALWGRGGAPREAVMAEVRLRTGGLRTGLLLLLLLLSCTTLRELLLLSLLVVLLLAALLMPLLALLNT